MTVSLNNLENEYGVLLGTYYRGNNRPAERINVTEGDRVRR